MRICYSLYAEEYAIKQWTNCHILFEPQNDIKNQNSQIKGKSLLG